MMTNLMGKISTTIYKTKERKDTKDSIHPQAKAKSHPYDVSLEFVPLRVIHNNKDKGKTYKPYEPSNIYAPKYGLVVSNYNIEINKTMNKEPDNINQTIETLNACDDPPSENIIDKILSNKTSSSKPLHETTIENEPNVVARMFMILIRTCLMVQ